MVPHPAGTLCSAGASKSFRQGEAVSVVIEPLPLGPDAQQARTLRMRIGEFLAPPDDFLLDAGKSAELLIAKIRLVLTVTLLLIPVANMLLAPRDELPQHVTGFYITLVAVVVASVVFALVLRDRRQRWLPWITSITDVSLISFALVVFAFIGDPHQVVNSKITFETYFLALGATCLRYDHRLTLLAGLVTIVEYLVIVAGVVVAWHLGNEISPYGRFEWSDQVSRVILLATGTLLNVSIVIGMQRQRTLSSSDRLTSVFNRGYFDEALAAEVERARRSGRGFAVAMLDVDHFKPFNDRYGHSAGDSALKVVASTIQRAVRRSDLVARYGGEEFVVIFPEATPEGAVERTEAIRKAVAAQRFLIPRRDVHAHLTVSAGVATWPVDGNLGEDLIAIADDRLFEAKDAGRNRVVGAPRLDVELQLFDSV